MSNLFYSALLWFLVASALATFAVLVLAVLYDAWETRKRHRQPIYEQFNPNLRKVL